MQYEIKIFKKGKKETQNQQSHPQHSVTKLIYFMRLYNFVQE